MSRWCGRVDALGDSSAQERGVVLTVASGRRLAAALVVLTVAGSSAAVAATSQTAPSPAAGTASSHLRLLNLSIGGHPISVGDLVLDSSDADASSAFTALTSAGRTYGDRSVSSGSVEVPSISSTTVLPDSLSKLVTVVTPAASMSSGAGSTRAGVDSFGSVRILGLPLALDGTASTSTSVDGVHAGAEKTLVVRNLALPSISGLLAALGLDISRLPTSTLLSLVDRLHLVDGTIADARAALDAALGPLKPQLAAAEQQVADAQAAVDAAKANLTSTSATLTGAATTLQNASTSLQGVLGTTPHLVRGALLGLPSPSAPVVVPTVLPSATAAPIAVPTVPSTPAPTAVPTVAPTAAPTALPSSLPTALPTALPTTLPSLPPVLPAGAQPVVDAYTAAASTYTDALQAVNDATGALNLANGLLNTASSTVNTLLSTVQTQVDAVVHAILGVLGATPLVSIDSFTVRTEASATSAGKGGQTARVVGGEIQGVHVLGNDVLQQTTHSDRADLRYLAGAPLDLLNQQIDAVTGALSGVLSAVPGLPTLSVPAPQIDLLSVSTATNIAGGFGAARTTVKALQITIPAITIPAALQKAGVGTLSVKAIGDVLTSPLVIGVGAMQDTASFRPAGTSGNTGVVPPGTGSGSFVGGPGTNPTAGSPSGSNPNGSNPSGSNPSGSNPNGTPIAGGPSGNPQLPRTGLPAGMALLAFGLLGAGLLLARGSRVA
jgi:hypothetical protein